MKHRFSNPKIFIYTGFFFLYLGVLTQNLSDAHFVGKILIFLGIGLKVFFLSLKIKYSAYKSGIELIFLFLGLTLFLSGLYLAEKIGISNKLFLIIPGISLKALFIIILVKKIKGSKTDKSISRPNK